MPVRFRISRFKSGSLCVALSIGLAVAGCGGGGGGGEPAPGGTVGEQPAGESGAGQGANPGRSLGDVSHTDGFKIGYRVSAWTFRLFEHLAMNAGLSTIERAAPSGTPFSVPCDSGAYVATWADNDQSGTLSRRDEIALSYEDCQVAGFVTNGTILLISTSGGSSFDALLNVQSLDMKYKDVGVGFSFSVPRSSGGHYQLTVGTSIYAGTEFIQAGGKLFNGPIESDLQHLSLQSSDDPLSRDTVRITTAINANAPGFTAMFGLYNFYYRGDWYYSSGAVKPGEGTATMITFAPNAPFPLNGIPRTEFNVDVDPNLLRAVYDPNELVDGDESVSRLAWSEVL